MTNNVTPALNERIDTTFVNSFNPKKTIAVTIKAFGTININAAAKDTTPYPPLNFKNIV